MTDSECWQLVNRVRADVGPEALDLAMLRALVSLSNPRFEASPLAGLLNDCIAAYVKKRGISPDAVLRAVAGISDAMTTARILEAVPD